MPISFTVRVRCETTRVNAESTNPAAGAGEIADPVTGEFTLKSRSGELGVVCTGEFIDPITGEAYPQTIGAAWPVLVEKKKPLLESKLNWMYPSRAQRPWQSDIHRQV